MKWVQPNQTVFIRGVPRDPSEGPQLVSDEEAAHFVAERLVDKDKVRDADDQDEAEPMPTGASSPDDLDSQKVEDLKALASAEGVDLGTATVKADIVAAIRAHRATPQA